MRSGETGWRSDGSGSPQSRAGQVGRNEPRSGKMILTDQARTKQNPARRAFDEGSMFAESKGDCTDSERGRDDKPRGDVGSDL